MKILKVDYEKFSTIEINFEDISHIVGFNEVVKKRLFFLLRDYFSSSKVINSENCKVELGGELLSENHFNFISIFNESDIDRQIGLGKDSLFFNAIKNIENIVEFNNLLMDLNDKFLSIDSFVEDRLKENFNYDVKVSSKEFNTIDYLKNLSDAEIGNLSVQFLSNYDKLVLFFSLLKDYVSSKSGSFVISLWDINNFLSLKEFYSISNLILELTRDFGIKFLIFSSTNGFIVNDVSFFEGINIVNDINFSFCSLDLFRESIIRNYPSVVDFSDSFIFSFVKDCSCILFWSDFRYGFGRYDVIIKVLNSLEGIVCSFGSGDLVDSLELAFLKS